MGPPPEASARADFTTEEVLDENALEVPDEPAPTPEEYAGAAKTSPRRAAASEETKSEWVAMEDPRTGYNYFMNRKTMKLAWNRVEMLHQEIAAEDRSAAKPKVAAPQAVAFNVRKSADPEYTSDSWSDKRRPSMLITEPLFLGSLESSTASSTSPTYPSPLAASSSSSSSSSSSATSSHSSSHAKPATTAASALSSGRPKGSPPLPANPPPALPSNTHGNINNNQHNHNNNNITSQQYQENRKGSIAVLPLHPAFSDPSIPTPPPADIPPKKPYRASIFLRPLPAPIQLPTPTGRPVPAGPPLSPTKTMDSPLFPSAPKTSAGNRPPKTSTPPIPISYETTTTSSSSHSTGSDSRHRAESQLTASSPRNGDERHRSQSFEAPSPLATTHAHTAEIDASADVINVAQVFKRPVPSTNPKHPFALPIVTSSSASSISPKTSAPPPVPSSVSMKMPTVNNARPNPMSAGTAPNLSTHSPPVASTIPSSPPTSFSARQMAPKPFTGPPPPVPSKMPSSRPPAHPPPNPTVLVTMDRGRAGSRVNRVSFRASISRVAPPTMEEIMASAGGIGGGGASSWSGSPSPLGMSAAPTSTSPRGPAAVAPPSSRLPNLPPSATMQIGPTIGVPTRAHNPPPMAAASVRLPPIPAKPTDLFGASSSGTHAVPKGAAPAMRISQSASTLGASTPNPYAQSLPALRMEAMHAGGAGGGAPATTKAPTTKQRPVLQKAFTTSGMTEPVYGSGGSPTINPELKAQINFFQLEGFAAQFFKSQKRGLFRRAVPIRERLKWTQGALKAPLLKLKSEFSKKALVVFKNIQICMGDRALDTTQDERYKLMVEIFDVGLNTAAIRDEIFCQLCKQTTLNPNADSNLRGWGLIALFLQYFTPTKDLEHWFMDYCREHEKNPQKAILPYVTYSLRVLNKPAQSGSTLRIPEVEEVELALRNPIQPRLFGVTLARVIENQKIHKIPDVTGNFPHILTALVSIIHRLNGTKTEGIFRIPGSHMLCTKLRLQLEAGQYSGTGLLDPHVPASVLKWWLRDLEEPLIPSPFYNACIEAAKSSNPDTASVAVINSLPLLHKTVVYSIINFVQILALPENIAHTKMAVGSLAIVFGPNLLRCQATEMMLVFEAQKWEQTFVSTLIKHLPKL